jgi:hypothetical protein
MRGIIQDSLTTFEVVCNDRSLVDLAHRVADQLTEVIKHVWIQERDAVELAAREAELDDLLQQAIQRAYEKTTADLPIVDSQQFTEGKAEAGEEVAGDEPSEIPVDTYFDEEWARVNTINFVNNGVHVGQHTTVTVTPAAQSRDTAVETLSILIKIRPQP